MAAEVVFPNRVEAGRILATRLLAYQHRPDVVVLGLARGGVPVAAEVARRLWVPLDVLVVRKLGVPGHRELAMGAIASGGIEVVDEELVEALAIPNAALMAIKEEEHEELARREARYRGNRPPLLLQGKTVLLVDDGLATGSTMKAAVRAVRTADPAEVVVAVPVAPEMACEELAREADQVVCLATPEPFYAVGLWFRDFAQVNDEQVRGLLEESAGRALQSQPGVEA